MLKLKSVPLFLLGTFAVVGVGIGLGPGCGGDDNANPTTTTTGGGGGAGGRGGAGGTGGKATGGGGTGGTGGATTTTTGGGAGATGKDAAGGTGGGGAGGGGGVATDSGGGADGGDAAEVAPPRPDGSAGVQYRFDTDLQGWHYTAYGSTPPNANPPGDPNNLANRSAPLVWDSTNDADNRIDASGSARASVPFAFANERIDVQAFATGTDVTLARNWTGYMITASVKLLSGGNLRSDCPLQAWLYVSSTNNFDTRLSPTVNLVTGSWVTITYDLSVPLNAGFLLSSVNQMGIQVTTGADCPVDAGAPEAGPVSDAAASDASADGGDGGDGAVVDAAPPPVPQATTAVFVVDNVIVSVAP